MQWSLRGAAVAQWTASRQPGVRFLVGTVYLPSFMSFARDSKSQLMGCNAQTKQTTSHANICVFDANLVRVDLLPGVESKQSTKH